MCLNFHRLAPLWLSLACLVGGCASATPPVRGGSNLLIVVPGLGGDGDVYAGVIHAARDAHCGDTLRVFDWGHGWGLFFVSLWSHDLHRQTEIRLAGAISLWKMQHPGARVNIIAHSAGAGVTLGALGRLDQTTSVDRVILLGPDVSPEFELTPALGKADHMDVFYSRHDVFWQAFCPVVFGSYDGSHGVAAGKAGFQLDHLENSRREKITQHPYDPAWEAYDNLGGHYDTLSPRFVAGVLLPLIEPTTAGKAR